eukprot:CAMPEP_0119293374 /NCGR_PEP_ID=MMETSP1329-20130426/45953_1 /TAXON_ID=114041 /ORGANISM="Genus nov. species nov., Strain RCC1024" /LENGTH=192 /DNA_ID=CAMNT_0007294243 /DNA_START=87 /DNA_END=661 /DNA_ORIENTATION=+
MRWTHLVLLQSLSCALIAPRRPQPHAHTFETAGRSQIIARAAADDDDAFEVVLTKPLGVTVQEVRGAVVVQTCRPGGAADAAGVQPGDAIVGVSAIFGDGVWDTTTAGLDRVEALIRSRDGEDITLRLQRGGGSAPARPAADDDEYFTDDVDTATFRGIFDDEGEGLYEEEEEEEGAIDDARFDAMFGADAP